VTGALLVDKPSGPTSHDVVAVARRLLKTSRIGHTGTLDPLATGLLVLLVGPATRLARFLAADEKEYIADVRLGVATPTYDAASLPPGVRYPLAGIRYPAEAELEAALDGFRGAFLQAPPPFSAKKVGGVRAYDRARKAEQVDLPPAPVTVHELQVLRSPDVGHRMSDIESGGLVRLRVVASAGFYVRSLAHDLGRALGCGAHLEALRRTRVGRFRIEEAATLDALQTAAGDRVLPIDALLGHLPAVTLTEAGLRRAAHGNALARAHLKNGDSPRFLPAETGTGPVFQPETGTGPVFRVLDPAGETMAVAEARPDGLLHPLVVLR
jgi:tRNA pseudouridine55 synthase